MLTRWVTMYLKTLLYRLKESVYNRLSSTGDTTVYLFTDAQAV